MEEKKSRKQGGSRSSIKSSIHARVSHMDAVNKVSRLCLERVAEQDIAPCKTDSVALLACATPKASDQPESKFLFRRALPMEYLDIGSSTDDVPFLKIYPLSNCLGISTDDLEVTLNLDLLFEQNWHFQALTVSSLNSTIALAPGEVLRLSVRSHQRKVLTRATLDEVEETESAEATIIDRDTLNATRSSARTDNWQVSGNASISIPLAEGLSLGLEAGGSMSSSTTQTVTSTAERVREATQKSATNLRNLHKVEVTEVTEQFEESSRTRRLENPYRDRSLLIKVFGLTKEFCVDFSLVGTRPSVSIEVMDVDFGTGFVRSNGDFLDTYLTDRRLAMDLPEALVAVVDGAPFDAIRRVERHAALALQYLYSVGNIFNVPDVLDSLTSVGDANAPSTSFDARLPNSGLSDAVSSNLTVVFSTLNFFYRMYLDEVLNAQGTVADPVLAVEIALSIEQALRPLWFELEERNEVRDVLDTNRRTEAFRRLGGFLAFVAGTIRPLLKPAEDERERVTAARRAEFVIARVVDHLNCHKEYYIAVYLEYLSRLTKGVTIRSFARDVLLDAANLSDDVEAAFAFESTFVVGRQIVIPGRCTFDEHATTKFLDAVDGEVPKKLHFGVLSQDAVFLPADGYHIEPIEGGCQLTGVPPLVPTPRVELQTEVPIQVSTSTFAS